MMCLSGYANAAEISLCPSAAIIDPCEASYVHYAVHELRQQLGSGVTLDAPVLLYDFNDAMRESKPIIVIGRSMASRLARECNSIPQISDSAPGDDGFILKTVQLANGKQVIVAAGSDSRGTAYAVRQLRQLLCESVSGKGISASLSMYEKPRFKTRGLYLHQHWRYNYPYATWSWSVEDWKRALDIAACMRVNLVLMWIHMDMMAEPLTIPEKDYLADIRQVIDYAHRKLGIEIWLVESPNVIIDSPSARRLPVEYRNYYAYHHVGDAQKNPGDINDIAIINANREALFQNIPNMDGFGLIDSDPGGYPGSPASDFVDMYVKMRQQLNHCNEKKTDAKLIYWMYNGWGNETPADKNWRTVVNGLIKNVDQPLELLVCYNPTMAEHAQKLIPQPAIAKESNYLDKTIFFSYQIVDGEPGFPLTTINFSGIDTTYDWIAEYENLKGVMANVQTYIVQLPNIYYFVGCGWNPNMRKADEPAVLNSLVKMIYPQQADILVRAWTLMHQSDANAAEAAAAEIDSILEQRQIGRIGLIGRYIFPDSSQIFKDLSVMLRLCARGNRVEQLIVAKADKYMITQAMADYLLQVMKWQKINGYFGCYNDEESTKRVWNRFISGDGNYRPKEAWQLFIKEQPDEDKLNAILFKAIAAGGYADWIQKDIAAELLIEK